jgi:DNA polymerase III alpha subunit
MTTPKHFVNLHGHDTFSVGDGIGMPQDHIDYAVKNGSDALAQTNHGNMNGYSYQYLHAKKLKDKGVNFKAIPGVEAYYIPSLAEWRKLKNAQDEAKAAEKEAKRLAANPDNIGDELASAKAELEEMAGALVKTDEDEMGGTVVENEDDSKSNKYRDPIQRRNHLVLLPKNTAGLKTLFRLVSNSYIDGFYKYPRIDLDMLKREAKGNLIALSACIEGNAMLETNYGMITLKNTVELVNQGKDVYVLSFSEEDQRMKFSKIKWGALTKKNAKVMKITLENGKCIKCTADHKFLTNHGWLRADELGKYVDTCILNSK